ncbi:protein takeout-like [Chelonus insularis]|uniref:protein takeout-like n=1 Tax=Chelonus insularis TaxID=460826 RepID=UPI00158A0F62|nr:protein takeout-like [Chelonus insularis]
MEYIVFLVLGFIAINQGAELPSSFKICKQSDPNLSACVDEAAVQAIESMANGIPGLNVAPVEPLLIEHMSIGQSGNVVSLEQNYQNIKVYGLSKGIKVSNYEIDFDKLIFKSDSINPQIDFVADCKIDGKLLVLHLHGSGPCNITMKNLQSKNVYYGEKYEKDGETYMKIKKFVVKFIPEKVILDFERLFEQNSFFSTQINSILNTNSDLLFKELKGSYEDTFSKVFAKIANDVFSQVPFRKIFPD